MSPRRRPHRSRRRVTVMLVVLVVVGVVTGFPVGLHLGPLGGITFGIAVGWAASCLEFMVTVWISTRHLDAKGTLTHARLEDPDRQTADLLLIAASVISVLAVIALLVASRNTHGIVAVFVAIVVLLCVGISWTFIHVLHMLAYARIYYGDPGGGISFNTDVPPRYLDFAYLAFDLGMTYQVSDTSVSTTELRGVILRHTLISYLLGAVVLASVINLVGGLS